MRIDQRGRFAMFIVFAAFVFVCFQACFKKEEASAKAPKPEQVRNASQAAQPSRNQDCITDPDSVMALLFRARDEKNDMRHDKLYRGTCIEIAGNLRAVERLAEPYCQQWNIPVGSYIMTVDTPWDQGFLLVFAFEKDRAHLLEKYATGDPLRVRGHYYMNEKVEGWPRVFDFLECEILN